VTGRSDATLAPRRMRARRHLRVSLPSPRRWRRQRRPEAARRVSRAFPSWTWSILAEIYLCHACSAHEIEDGNARAGALGLSLLPDMQEVLLLLRRQAAENAAASRAQLLLVRAPTAASAPACLSLSLCVCVLLCRPHWDLPYHHVVCAWPRKRH
jgi:hypothetical protein